jgi:hypothetical protein
MNWYSTKVKVTVDNGKTTKKETEQYLVNAVSVTDAEVKINGLFKNSNLEFEVASVTATKIVDVIN